MSQVLFIGAGKIGTALAHVIGSRAAINLWDQDPAQAPSMLPLAESVPLADVIFLCTPSWTIRAIIEQIMPFLRPVTVIVSLAKGLEAETQSTMDTVLANLLPAVQPWGILGGPLLADELTDELPGIGVFGSASRSAYLEINKLFLGSNVRLEYSSDPHTIALAAVLKNIYAVILGLASGLGWGYNGQGWLAARALGEMTEIVSQLGNDATLIAGPAGAGDFLATAMSPDSHNRTAGQELAKTGRCTTTNEGCRSLPTIITLLNNQLDQFPLLSALNQIVEQHAEAATIFHNLLTTPEIK